MTEDFYNSPEFQELIDEYLTYLVSELGKAREALERKEFLVVQKFGHNLKGTGKGYGFEDLSQLGAQIEQDAMQENAASLPGLLARLERMLNKHRTERAGS